MSSRRRRSGDFTTSIVEYHRTLLEEENSYTNDTHHSNLQNLEPTKKNMVIVKSNETIPLDTTIFNKISTLRSQLNSQKESMALNSKSRKIARTPERILSTETTTSPITDVLNKINKALEIKQSDDNSKSKVETCRQEPSKLWNALSTFNRSLSSNKNGVQSHQKVLSRLSQEFHSSPTKFAEKLVTIIEESVMPSISDQKDCSGVSVHRMTQEFRKLCKFIEDESMPEWIMSPDVIHEEQIENQSIEFVDESSLEEFETFASTPLDNKQTANNCINSYTETPKGIFQFHDNPSSSGKKAVNKVIKNSRFNDTNNSFEYWESMCNGVFVKQRITPQKLRRSLSLPESPATRMNNIRTTCERQMASLDDTVINQNQTENKSRYFQDCTEGFTFSLEDFKAARTPEKKYFSEQSEEIKKIKRTKKISPKKRAPILRQPENIKIYSPNCEDDLDKSFLAELAQRRQRCFETAKLMMEIDKNDPIVTDKKNTAELISKLGSPNKTLSLPENNTDFLSTINHCMEYQDFLLKKRKSIFHIIQHPKSSDTDSEIVAETNSKLKSPFAPSENFLAKSAKLTPVDKIIKSEKKSPRRRFFVTPGKSPKNDEVKKKKEYFPQMESIVKVQTTLNFAKSPRTPEIRKNIYEYVRSPVAEYIKGTDPKLVKNIQAKNNDWLLTPQPLGISSESEENRMTPLKNIQEGSALKFNLSPMSKKIVDFQALEGENIPENEFKLPKIVYKSPANIHMIKENSEIEKKTPGLRMKNLLKSAEKKVVIRHEGRVATTFSGNKGNDEIDDKMLDTSVHVKTIAKKTDFIRTKTLR